MKILFNYLIFPGFLFSAVIGLMAGWLDRKITARLQYRVGPPWYQNFMDIAKLFNKETILPEGAKVTFLLAPYLGFLSLVLAATILGMNLYPSPHGFAGDLIVVVYLLVIPAIALIIGAFSSANPFASIGAAREMKMVLGYELPFILSLVVALIKSGGSIRLGQIISHQALAGSNIASISGAIAFVVAILYMQAKLCMSPFDASEAEQEIMCGALVEYSGFSLAVFKLTSAIMLYIMPLFLIILFWAGDMRPLVLIDKYMVLLLVIILIKNTNPRVRVDQAVNFFWMKVSPLAFLAVLLAIWGK